MKNGQLKPCYNVNVATASEYVIGCYLSADCTDTNTLIPFTRQLPMDKIQKLMADAGYESEENYTYFEGLEHTDAYIKPANHEQKKHKKYRTDPGRRENMTYRAETDEYICTQGKRLIMSEVKKQKTKTGFLTETSIYYFGNYIIAKQNAKALDTVGSSSISTLLLYDYLIADVITL